MQQEEQHVKNDVPGRSITSSRIFSATQQQLFQAWTDPVLLARWWGPKGFTNTFQEFDLRPGGAWNFIMHGPDGTAFHNRSVFMEVVVPERIMFRHLGPVHEFDAIFTFEPSGQRTLMTFLMQFDSVAEYHKIGDYIRDANEENFDKLEALILTI